MVDISVVIKDKWLNIKYPVRIIFIISESQTETGKIKKGEPNINNKKDSPKLQSS